MLSVVDTRPFPGFPAQFNLAEHVLAKGLDLPEKPALEIFHPSGTEIWTYAQLTTAVLGCGGWLLNQGLCPGDRVLVRLGNTAAFPILHLGAIAAGLVSVATSAALTKGEITRLALHIKPRVVVAGEGLALPDHPAPVLSAMLDVWKSHAPCAWHRGDPDREAYVVFTSGSSGAPLAVRHAHRAIVARRAMHRGWEGLGHEDRLFHAGAFNWTYTMGTGLMDPWTVGATALIAADQTPVASLADMLSAGRATIFAAAPGVYRQILRGTLPPLPHLRHGLSAGEAMPAPLKSAWQAATGTLVHEALGMSEISTYVSGAPDRPAPPGATGYVQNARHVAILADAAPVPRGTAGMLAVSRHDPGLMLGYEDRPAPAGDWFVTGDVAVMAEDGAITMLGREDEMMNPGGFRVSPAEVEAAMLTFPALSACAVTEVEVSPGTRIIGCFYESAEPLNEADLARHAETTLARWKQPRLWHHLHKMPRTANGKLNRRALATTLLKERS